MAETPFPNPLTSSFNPEAWGSTTTISADEIAFLDNNFVRFPTTQPNVTFPVAPTVPTLPIGTGDTRAASAQFVQNAKNTRTWGGLQTFNSGMVTTFIDPTTPGGTLTIGQGAANNNVEVASQINRSTILHLGDGASSTGGIHIGNGLASTNQVQILYSGTDAGASGTINLGTATSTTNLRCPLTPLYTYPVSAGQVGFTTTVTAANVAAVQNTPATLITISLPKGVWFVSFTAGLTTSTAGGLILGINETTNSLINARGISAITGVITIPPINTATTVLSHNDGVNKTYYGIAQYSLTGGTWTGIEMYATRLA
jgi:hypothetical protein